MDQIQTVVWQVFCARFGRSFCHGNEHHGIDRNILSSGHHESWLFHKGCISLHSCQTAILPHLGTLTSPVPISIHFRKSFSCSMKFFQLKITLGLALGESWPLLAQPQKSIDVYKGLLPWEGLPRPTSINHLRRNKEVNSWIKFRVSYDNSSATALGRAFAMGTNTMVLKQTC